MAWEWLGQFQSCEMCSDIKDRLISIFDEPLSSCGTEAAQSRFHKVFNRGPE